MLFSFDMLLTRALSLSLSFILFACFFLFVRSFPSCFVWYVCCYFVAASISLSIFFHCVNRLSCPQQEENERETPNGEESLKSRIPNFVTAYDSLWLSHWSIHLFTIGSTVHCVCLLLMLCYVCMVCCRFRCHRHRRCCCLTIYVVWIVDYTVLSTLLSLSLFLDWYAAYDAHTSLEPLLTLVTCECLNAKHAYFSISLAYSIRVCSNFAQRKITEHHRSNISISINSNKINW